MSEELITPLDPKSSFKDDIADMNSAIIDNDIKQIYSLLYRYKKTNTSDSDIFRILYQSYYETILKNIPLSDNVKLVVETELVEIYYRCFDSNDPYPTNLSWIRGKIRCIETGVDQLKNYKGVIDQEFMYIMTVLVKDIYLLKRLMKSTYDSIPWEEIEFCLTIFLLAHKRVDKINFYYHSYLKRERIMRHLEIFLDCLNRVDKSLDENTDVSKLSCFPKKPRPDIVKKICRECTQITDLYDDFHKLRDICSLNEIEKYLSLVRSCDASQIQGRLTIIRCLQVMGEHMKNTLGSPKMSPFNVDLLVSRMTTNMKQMISKIRDKISHGSITNITKVLSDNVFFLAIKNDLENTSDTIRQLLKHIKLEAFQNFIKLFENVEGQKIVAKDELLYYFDHENTFFDFDSTYKPEEIVRPIQPDPVFDTEGIKMSTDSLYDIARADLGSIKLTNKRLLSIRCQRFINNLKVLKEIKGKDQLLKKIINEYASPLLKDMPKIKCEPLFKTLMSSLMHYMYSSDKIQDESKLAELNSIADCFLTYGSNTSIEKLWMLWEGLLSDDIPGNNVVEEVRSETSGSNGDTVWKFLEDDLAKKFENIKNGVEVVVNQEQLALIELYILDQLPCLETTNFSQHTIEPLDNIPLLLTAKRLRNHLAHHNFLNYILIPDITVALVANAIALYRKHSVNLKGRVPMDLLLVDHKADLEIISLQKKLFGDLMKADLDDLFKNAYSISDFRGRDAQGKGSLHYAAMAQQIETVKYLLERSDLNLNVNAQDIFLETPLHISARFDRPNVTKHLLDNSAAVEIKDRNGFQPIHYAVANDFFETTKVLLNKSGVSGNYTSSGNTALHIAAKFGSPIVAKHLIDNSEDLTKENSEGFTPLHNAVLYEHIDLVKLLVEKVNPENSDELERILSIAVCTGSEEIVKYLLEDGVLANKFFLWRTPLLEAAHYGNEKIINILLKHNVDINAVDLDGFTSLHNILNNCITIDRVEKTLGIVGGFIKAGCSVNARSVRGYSPLYLSLNQSNYIVELLLECGAAVNAQTIYGNTSLHRAASIGAADKINLLLKYCADLNIVNHEGLTPLHFAARHGNLDVLELLLEKGLNIYSKDKYGNEPLHYAAKFGNKLITELILNKCNNENIDVTNNTNLTPLHYAVMHGDLEYVKFVISKRANVNLRDIEGATPLHLAVTKGNCSVVKLLLDNEAEIDSPDETQVTPLTIAIRYNMKSIVQLLLKRGSKIDMFSVNAAIKTSHFMAKKVILDKKEILTQNIQGFSVFHCACLNGSPELVYQLLLDGADVNAVDDKNLTPLHHAGNRGDKTIIEILLNHGADPNKKQNGVTPLELAINHGQTESVKVFLEKSSDKIDLNYLDENGSALLHRSIFAGHKDIVLLLISKGADINLTDNCFHLKPLYLATILGNSEIVMILLNKGCDIENMREKSLLHLAAYHGRTHLMNTLIGMEGDVNVKCDQGFTPLHIAAIRDHKDAVLTLLNHGAQTVSMTDLRFAIQVKPEIAKIIEASDKLYESVKKNDLEETRKCIEDGAVTNTTASEGETALHCAVNNNFTAIINILLENCSNPNIKNKTGETALHLASKLNNRDVLKLLLSRGAQYDSLSSTGQTPLDLTNDEIIAQILQKVIYVFEMVERNEIAVIERVKETILNDPSMKIILVNTRNKEKKTLLEVAYRSDFVRSQDVKILLDEELYKITSIAKDVANRGEIYEALAIVERFECQNKTLKNVISWDLHLLKAYLYCHSLQIDSCKTLLNRIHKEQEESLGPEHNLTLLTLIQIATFSSFIGENDEALKILRKICQLLIKSNENSTDLFTGVKFNIFYRCTSLIGNTLCLLKKYEEALAFSKDAFFYLSRERGAKDEKTLEAQVIYASNLLSLNRCDEALTFFKDAQYKQLKLYDKTNLVALSTTNLIQTTLCFMDKYHDSVKDLKEVLKIQKRLLPECHPDVLSSQNNLAYSYFLKHRFLNAYGLAKLTYERGQIIFGKSHPHILSALEVLVTLNNEGVDLHIIFQNLQKDLILAIINGDVVKAERLILNGASIDIQDDMGRNALHWAVIASQPCMVKFLLSQDVATNIKDKEGQTPRAYALNDAGGILQLLNNHEETLKLKRTI